MKIVVACDGSSGSDAALDDVFRAGLPDTGEAVVISVSELWLRPTKKEISDSDPYVEALVQRHSELAEHALKDARLVSERASKQLQAQLPQWTIMSEATYGSPAWEILSRADEFGADLIIVGSHGHSAIGRLVLGSISQKILTEAHCSVRVARAPVEVEPSRSRVMIGFDCSKGATAAIDAVAHRNWDKNCEFQVVAVADPLSPSLIGQFIPPVARAVDEMNAAEYKWIETEAVRAIDTLAQAGYAASLKIFAGNAKHVLVEEAERWRAGCIFVGAHSYSSRAEKYLLGSTSAAVAARAHCSVEVVRI